MTIHHDKLAYGRLASTREDLSEAELVEMTRLLSLTAEAEAEEAAGEGEEEQTATPTKERKEQEKTALPNKKQR
ncbi:MAG: hypothetical protein J6Z36_02360 [Clostridia bacterium]|nr:hypothetical protein [Clostridia bacterium]